MKLSAIILASSSAFTGLVSAWNVDLYGTDGRHANFHGTQDSGCKDISFTPAINVNRARFDPSTPFWPDPGTFQLFVRANCQGLSYSNDGGDYALTPPRVIRSYKVF